MNSQDLIEVGQSPVPGLTLRGVLQGHRDKIDCIEWSPDGRYLASSSVDKTVRVWDVERGRCANTFDHDEAIDSVAWSPDGQCLAAGSEDGLLHIWSVETDETVVVLSDHQPSDYTKPKVAQEDDDVLDRLTGARIDCVAWSAGGNGLASGGQHEKLLLWNTESWHSRSLPIESGSGICFGLAWSPDGQILAAACTDGRIRSWRAPTMGEYWNREVNPTADPGNKAVNNIAFAPDGKILAGASQDSVIHIMAADTGEQLVALEGHTGVVNSVSFSPDGKLLASKSHDGTIRFWRCDDWSAIAQIDESIDTKCVFYANIAFHPRDNVLATYGGTDQIIRIWDLDVDVLLHQQPVLESVRYTTAKVVLVGDSGVGKTGLGWRLAHNEFKEHASTHGQQFWVIQELSRRREDGTECEAVLWDLAGQHIYRPIHAIFLEDVDAALVLFDPTNREDTLKGVQFWVEQLSGTLQIPPTILVGARSDRGSAALSLPEIEQFCSRYGIHGGYLSTSAKTGAGLDQLLEILKQEIPWDRMTATVTTTTFKRIKTYVLTLKEETIRTGVLVSSQQLRERLQDIDAKWLFSDAEMMVAVKHLQNHGYVTILRSSSGVESILLTPDLLVDLASSIVLQADKHPHDLGSLRETDLLQGRYPLEELNGLEWEEKQVLLDAAVARFVDHNICFRESLGQEVLLIFPGLIKQKRPLLEEPELIDDMSYVIHGRTENVYAALVVLLGYTPTFTRINQWQNQAQYELGKGEICGFRLIADREGEIELVLYHSAAMPKYGVLMFRGLFEQFLYQRDVEVTPFPPVICSNGHIQERATVVRRVRENKASIFCDECGAKISLPRNDVPGVPGAAKEGWIRREEALARLRTTYETYLVRVKGYRRDRAAPRCYLSHVPQQAEWVVSLSRDLREAGVVVLKDLAEVTAADMLIIVSTAAYRQAWDSADPVLSEDRKLIRSRLNSMEAVAARTIQLTLEESATADYSFGSKQRLSNDFSDESYYLNSLFSLILFLYAIRTDNPAFEPMREGLHRQWLQQIATLPKQEPKLRPKGPLSIFISYSHEDEAFKDSLVKMLAVLQRRGVIDAWQDRRIEEGDEWRASIQRAMDECDLGLLLVSSDFLASRFIQEQELPRLLQRRKDEGMRVIPIIVRPCLWQSEPVLSDLQALPKNAKAVITFSESNGERDQVWTDICRIIETRTKEIQR